MTTATTSRTGVNELELLPPAVRERLVEVAKETHRFAWRAAERKNFGLSRHPRWGEGRVMASTVARMVHAAASLLGGEAINDGDVALVRRYLRRTGNVVVLDELADRRYRIFVSEHWRDSVPPPSNGHEPDAIDQRAAKLTPTEAGEDRAPEPVEVRQDDAVHEKREKRVRSRGGYRDRPVFSPLRLVLLRYLRAHGPVEGKNAMAVLAEAVDEPRVPVSAALKDLGVNGLVDRHIVGKRTKHIAITEAGLDQLRKRDGDERYAAYQPPTPARHDTDDEADWHERAVDGGTFVFGERPSPRDALYVLAELVEADDGEPMRAPSDVVALRTIEATVQAVNAGHMSPLEALGAIEKAVRAPWRG